DVLVDRDADDRVEVVVPAQFEHGRALVAGPQPAGRVVEAAELAAGPGVRQLLEHVAGAWVDRAESLLGADHLDEPRARSGRGEPGPDAGARKSARDVARRRVDRDDLLETRVRVPEQPVEPREAAEVRALDAQRSHGA